jgi:hypothetical protein
MVRPGLRAGPRPPEDPLDGRDVPLAPESRREATVLAYQAHHVDTNFYDPFYRPEALTQAHRQHPDH